MRDLPRVVGPTGAVGPVDATVVPRFAGPSTFARLPRLDEVERADVVVVGVPFDTGVSYRPGARFGPMHVRAASRLLRPYHPSLDVEPFGDQQVADAGDLAVNPFDLDDAIATIEAGARTLVDETGATLLTIGGDHTIALPLLRVAAERHGPVAVLHFDAHLDTWDTYFGAPYTHGTPFRRASEEGLIDRTASCHVGVRGPCTRGTTCRRTPSSGSCRSTPTSSRRVAWPASWGRCGHGSVTLPCTCRSTSTSSTPPPRLGRGRRKPAG
jgi:agmatinase